MVRRVFTDSVEFGRALQGWVDAVDIRLDDGLRRLSLSAFENIVRRTPVDTGWARANWNITLNERNDEEGAVSSALSVAQAQAAKMGDVVWIQNAVPYIQSLEHGHSKQAPEGMVELTMAELETFLGSYFE